jgi:hypothetical protein
MDKLSIGEPIVAFENSALVSTMPPGKVSVAKTLIEVRTKLALIKVESNNPRAMIVRAFLTLAPKENCNRSSLIYRFEQSAKPIEHFP